MATVTLSPRVAHNPGNARVSRPSRASRSSAVRLTARGRRLARTVIVALALAITLGVAIFGHISSSQASSVQPARTTAVVIVQPGQTMWGLAQQIAPNDDPRDTIARIADLNALSDDDASTVYPGQRLVVPASA